MRRLEEFNGVYSTYSVDVVVLMTIKAPHGTLTLWNPGGIVIPKHGHAIKAFMKWQRGMERRTNVCT